MAPSHRSHSEESCRNTSYPRFLHFEQVGTLILSAELASVIGNHNVAANRAQNNTSQLNSITRPDNLLGWRRSSSPARLPSTPPLQDQPPRDRGRLQIREPTPSPNRISDRQVLDVTDHETQNSDSESIGFEEGSSELRSNSDSESMPQSSRDPPNVVDHTTVERDEEIEPTDDIRDLDAGDVFTVMHAAAQITKRTFIVMAKTANGLVQCVSLCRHGGLSPKTGSAFLTYHCKVDDGRAAGSEDGPEGKRRVKINFRNNETTRLRDDCWTNCQHVFTVSEVGFRRDGEVDQFPEFLAEFWKIQKKMYKQQD